MSLSLIASPPPKGRHRRVLSAIIGQKRKHHSCPELQRLDGKRVLVTGEPLVLASSLLVLYLLKVRG